MFLIYIAILVGEMQGFFLPCVKQFYYCIEWDLIFIPVEASYVFCETNIKS